MKEYRAPEALAASVQAHRCSGRSIGFVPTMGALHAGHLRLLEVCRAENDVVVLSIYVNPAQFEPNEDFTRYPRDIERDLVLAHAAGVDALFLPSDETMYPGGVERQTVWIDPGEPATYLESRSRPGHFRGVATIVAKLFAMVKPDKAYFGQKDAQQAIIVALMTRELAMGVDIRVVSTVRESDGLALSSRNVYLTEDQRAQAPALKDALDLVASEYAKGVRDASTLEGLIMDELAERAPSGRVDYVALASIETLRPVTGDVPSGTLVALAVNFGTTRLIDNVVLES